MMYYLLFCKGHPYPYICQALLTICEIFENYFSFFLSIIFKSKNIRYHIYERNNLQFPFIVHQMVQKVIKN